MLCLAVPRQDAHANPQKADDGGNLEGATEEIHLFLPEQVVGTDAHNEEPGRSKSACQDMRQLHPQVRVEDEGEEVSHFSTAIVENVTDGLLHERVSGQNPEGGEVCGQGDQPDGKSVLPLGEFVLAEYLDTQER